MVNCCGNDVLGFFLVNKSNLVVDMVAVLNCISSLESLPIRREDLERTRLGRVINELRKRTSDVALQRRAKDLVRSWRRLLDENPPAVGLGSTPNGTVHHLHTPHTPHTPHAAQKVSSPALSGGVPATPATSLGASHGGSSGGGGGSGHGGHTRVAQLQMQSGVGVGVGVGAGSHHGGRTSPALSSSVSNSPVLRTRNGSGFKPVSPAVPTGSPSPNAVAPLASHAGGVTAGQPSTPPSASNAHKAPNRNSVANKRLRKADMNSSPPEAGPVGSAGTGSSVAKRGRQVNGFDSLLPGSISGLGDAATGASSGGTAKAAGNAGASTIPSGNSAFESLVRPDSRTGSVHSDDAASNGASGIGGNVSSTGSGGNGSGTPATRIVPKVKTTQQLIDELKAKSGVNVSIDDVVKEPPPPDRGISPAVAAAKGRRGRPPTHARDSPPVTSSLPLARQAAVNNAAFNRLLNGGTSDRELTQNKTELMDRFLLSSPQSQSDDSNHLPASNSTNAQATTTTTTTLTALTNGHHSGHHSSSSMLSRLANGMAPTSDAASEKRPAPTGPSGAPLVSYDNVDADINRILSKLPPLPADVYDWRPTNGPEAEQELTTDGIQSSSSVFPARSSAAPTEEELERISNGRWPCVNGNYDMHGEWRPWNELMMARSAGEEPLPVLPYVDIEW
ncbi:mucin-19-like isoform X2 [Varroa destructor]|uniref:Mediator of RNA polymerase II transcription subunit 26 n=1 Tax=Varroa destructor TaxID=109461 RepID=A0A7M7JEM4_VARDE|nr:mucin-19-like isoform X2 [Varroa destructor]